MAVLDASLIRRAATLPGASDFPFLKPFSRPATPGCCGRQATGPNPKTAIDAVLRLGPAQLAKFKALVGADKLTVWAVRAARMTKIDL